MAVPVQQVSIINITIDELQNAITKGVAKQLSELKEFYEPVKPVEFLTRIEVSKLLKINLSTLHGYVKNNVVQSYQMEGSHRVYFKRSEIEARMLKVKK
ncbi:MerR family transcriptional regulator [Tenacibaculum finnmarkense]|uniref:DNA-binding protein n=1 Tax=Tenacibaculum finnmarkense genomovar ulcerans TaxID=2781388 RepID=A0A2I2M9E2_9FLAO|nr:DNA-binding protein [Tenacibaculum finnmarkense]MBE7691523.1 DNA-binding protein [Tenacibaculum finnmarkense genomovar finnmarkense]MBE7697138.1 DNA-binding protein [Tenacibaculum finnmarkense genomovar ulcerans]SOU88680.1 DNA-binding protein [Tenacibaculum finnmarkense genomovar ulcerans]